jgi:hypothetical protein
MIGEGIVLLGSLGLDSDNPKIALKRKEMGVTHFLRPIPGIIFSDL